MNREKEIYKVTLVGNARNVVLPTFKFIAGILGHSSAMIDDAVHSLYDFITHVIVRNRAPQPAHAPHRQPHRN